VIRLNIAITTTQNDREILATSRELSRLYQRTIRVPSLTMAGDRPEGAAPRRHGLSQSEFLSTEMARARSAYGEFGARGANFRIATAWRIGCGEIWTNPPKPRSSSRNIPTAAANPPPAKRSSQSCADLMRL